MNKFHGLSSFALHLLAMLWMLCDHLWATLFPAQEWLTCLGRMAFPIFAFLTAQGYFHTSNIRRYMGRMLLFAILSEIPFNLIYGSSPVYPFHQNVLWTFLMALFCIRFLETVKTRQKWWIAVPVMIAAVGFVYLLGTIMMVDYLGAGVLTVLVFWFFNQKTWWCFLGQLVCLSVLNIGILGGYYYSISLFGHEFEIVQQGFAVLALIPIWLYNGTQGYHSKAFQYACYAFYPIHMLILYGIWQCIV